MRKTKTSYEELNARLKQAEATIEALSRKHASADIETLDPTHIQLEGLKHELHTHQEELEVQNQQLRDASLQLQEAHDRYQDLYDFAPVGYVSVDADGVVREANLTIARMLDIERSQLVDAPFTKFIHLDDQDTWLLHWRKLVSTDKPEVCELRLRPSCALPAGGTQTNSLDCELRTEAIHENDALQSVRIAVLDINLRMHAEARSRASESRLKLAQKAAHIGTWDWNIQTNVATCTEEYFRMYGLEPGGPMPSYEDWLGRVHPDDRQRAGKAVHRALQDHQPYDIQYRVIWPDGSIHWHDTKATVLRDECGRPLRMIGVNIDVTERKRAERELKLSENRYRTMVQFAPEAIVVHDVDENRFVEANDNAAKLFGYSCDELLNMTLDHVSAPTQTDGRTVHEHASDKIPRVLAGEQLVFEWIHLDRGGNEFPCEIRLVRLPHASRRLVRGSVIDITQRKQAEAALRDSEMRLKLALDAGRMGTWDWNVRTGELIWSDGHYDLHGYEPGAVQPSFQMWSERVHPDDLPLVEARLQQARETGEDFECEYRVVWPDGTTRWIKGRGKFEYDEAGLAKRMYGVVADIDEQMRTEEEMRVLTRSIKASTNGILITDARRPDNPIIFCNPAFEKITGYSADEVRGHNCRFLQGDQPDRSELEPVRAAIKQGREVQAVLRNYRKDGSLFFNELHIAPIRDHSGKLTHFVGIQNDITRRVNAEQELKRANDELETRVQLRTGELDQMITELKQEITRREAAEADLRDGELRLRLITNSLPVVISYVDKDLRYRFNNAAYKIWFDVQPESLHGTKVADFVGPEAFAIVGPFYERALGGETVEFREELPFRKLGLRIIEGNLVPHVDDQGEVQGVYVMATDVTERIGAQEKLKQQQDELAHMGRVHLAGEMASSIAHEINQPMVAISLQSEICSKLIERLRKNDTIADLHEAFSQITEQTQRAGRIIKFLRNFIQKTPTHRSTRDINAVIEESCNQMESEASRVKVPIRRRLARELPRVLIDRIQIQQVLVNVLRNAMEAMQDQDIDSREVLVSTALSNGNVEVIVSDRGVGIDLGNLERVFDSFYTTKPNGMGLGLAICKTIIESHGGRLWATPNSDQGVAFHFTIPIHY